MRLFFISCVTFGLAAAASVHAAAYFPKDTRRTLPDYAQSHNISLDYLEDVISASGQLDCKTKFDHKIATANVVLNQRVLITNAHLFCDVSNKKGVLEHPSDCEFKYFDHEQKKTRFIRLSQIAATGNDCGKRRNPNHEDDWAVAILKTPATGTHPYALPAPGELLAKLGRIHVYGDHAMDFCTHDANGHCILDKSKFSTQVRKYYVMPHFFEDCRVRDYSTSPKNDHILYQLFSDCAVSNGASGGPWLSWELNAPVLLGITAKNSLSDADKLKESLSGEPVMREFHYKSDPKDPIDDWTTDGVPIDGPFAEAIRAAAGV